MLCFWCRECVHAELRSLDALAQNHTPRLSKVRGSVNNLQPVQGPGSGTQTGHLPPTLLCTASLLLRCVHFLSRWPENHLII
jgi:hypothetical protein